MQVTLPHVNPRGALTIGQSFMVYQRPPPIVVNLQPSGAAVRTGRDDAKWPSTPSRDGSWTLGPLRCYGLSSAFAAAFRSSRRTSRGEFRVSRGKYPSGSVPSSGAPPRMGAPPSCRQIQSSCVSGDSTLGARLARLNFPFTRILQNDA